MDGVTQTLENYQASQTQANKDNSALGKDAFLQLLVTQMKYQDPLDPQDNGEYLAQLAQFSALEQMTNVADGLSDVSKLVSNIDTSVLVGQLSNMIGKDIQWTIDTTSTDQSYKVAIGNIIRIGEGVQGSQIILAMNKGGENHAPHPSASRTNNQFARYCTDA